jgi:hypothetical protein
MTPPPRPLLLVSLLRARISGYVLGFNWQLCCQVTSVAALCQVRASGCRWAITAKHDLTDIIGCGDVLTSNRSCPTSLPLLFLSISSVLAPLQEVSYVFICLVVPLIWVDVIGPRRTSLRNQDLLHVGGALQLWSWQTLYLPFEVWKSSMSVMLPSYGTSSNLH